MLAAIVIMLCALAGCRGCAAETSAAPVTSAPSESAAPSASASSALTAETPSSRFPTNGPTPGSWKKGFVPPVTTPATSSTVPAVSSK